MQHHINELQDIVRKIVRQVLEWGEVRFKRITMSHDASDNPAEVYGANGKIYYRKEGGAAVELGGIEQSLWEAPGANTQLVTPDDIDMQSTVSADYGIVNSGDIELYDGSTTSPRLDFRVPILEGFSGFYVDYNSADGMLQFKNRETGSNVTTISDSGSLKTLNMWVAKGERLSFGSPDTAYIYQDATTNDLKFFDTILNETKTLSELATPGIWKDTGLYAELLTARAIDMQYESIIHIGAITGGIAEAGFEVAAIQYESLNLKTDNGYTTISDTTQSAKFSPTLIDFYRDLSMGGNSISSCPDVAADGVTGYIAIAGGTSYPGAVVAYGEEHSSFTGDVHLYVPNLLKDNWLVGLSVDGVSDTPIVTIPYGLNMNDKEITDLYTIRATDIPIQETEDYDELHIKSQSGVLDIAIFRAMSDDSSGVLDMRGHYITNLCPADSYGHAVEISQLGGLWTAGDILYAKDSNTLDGLSSSGAATKVLTMNAGETAPEWVVGGGDYVHPDARQCTIGTWAWSAISNIPSTLEYTTNKNIANGYCGIGSDGYMPTIALLPSMITGSLYVANNLNTMAELPVGTAANGNVLTLDNTQTLGMKWADPGEPDLSLYLPLSAGSSKPLTGSLYLGTHGLVDCRYIKAAGTDSSVDIHGGSSQAARIELYGENNIDYSGNVHVYIPDSSKLASNIALKIVGCVDTPIIDIMYGLDMSGKKITGLAGVQANDINGIECCYSGGMNMLSIATSSYAFSANANANMNTHNIINVGGITMFSGAGIDMSSGAISSVGGITMVKGEHLELASTNIAYIYQDATTNALSFYDTVLGVTKTLSELAAGGGSSTFTGLSDTPTDYTGAAGKYMKVNSVPDGLEFADIGSTYWEAVDANTIRPKSGYTTLQGIESNDLYIKPASGKILYLG